MLTKNEYRQAPGEEIQFKYYKPVVSRNLKIGFILLLFVMVYFLIKQYPKHLLNIGFLIIAAGFGILYLIEKKFTDLQGSIVLGNEECQISSLLINKTIRYDDIVSITRECYNRPISLGIVDATQPVPGQFRIVLKNDKDLIFRIAHSEEKAYTQTIQKLSKKIYKTNRLGVHLNTKKFKDYVSDKKKEEQFEKEKPLPNYSVEKMIHIMLSKSHLELDDLT